MYEIEYRHKKKKRFITADLGYHPTVEQATRSMDDWSKLYPDYEYRVVPVVIS